jgi:flagellin
MAMTVTNINTMQLLNIVNKTSTRQSNLLTQLSTGSRINRAADDPAGLIALEKFNSELTAVNGALENNQRANAMVSTAEGGLNEISSLLGEVQKLALASVNDSSLSQAEIQANQSQIDSALASIDRIANTTTFNGKQLLNGEQGIKTTQATSRAENLRVFSRGQGSSDVTVNVKTTTAATSATATFAVGGATLSGDHEIVITGSLGSQQVSLGDTTTVANVVAAINAASAATGVDAVDAGSNNIRLESSAVGGDETVEMTVLSGGTLTDVAQATGTDAVLTVNGRTVNADGTDVSYSANGLSLEFSMATALNAANATETITVKAGATGGGMTFQLGVDASTQSTIGIDSMASYNLGGGDAGASLYELKSGGSADLASKSANTLKAVEKAIGQVASAKGRIGGFQRFQVETSINSLTQMKESLTAAKSVISDTDFAQATSDLNRESVLLNSGISLLGLANQQASQILSLLG